MHDPIPAVSPVRIAVIQYDPQVGLEQCQNNLCKSLALVRQPQARAPT